MGADQKSFKAVYKACSFFCLFVEQTLLDRMLLDPVGMPGPEVKEARHGIWK